MAMARSRWIRLDVDYFHHPRALAAGRDGRALHVASICWCASQLTDGHIPGDAVPSILADAGVNRRAVDSVTAAGLWVPTGGDFYVKDYLDRNPSRGDVEKGREQWKARQQRHRGADGRFTDE
jgi:hypothetical protein